MQSENVHHIIYSFWLLYIKESVREEKYKNACVIRNIWCTDKNEKEIENQHNNEKEQDHQIIIHNHTHQLLFKLYSQC